MFRVGRRLRLVTTLLAVAGGFLAGVVLDRFASIGRALREILVEAERIEVSRLTIASTIIAEQPSQTALTRAQAKSSVVRLDPPSAITSAVLTEVSASVPAVNADRSSEVLAQQALIIAQERARALKMMARGERQLQEGNVAAARQLFLVATEAGLARGAYLLGATYDSHKLARLHVIGVQPNAAAARKWYERARELGTSDAKERLVHLAPDQAMKILGLAVGGEKVHAVAKKVNSAFIVGAHRKKCGWKACSAHKRLHTNVVSIREGARRKCKGSRCLARGRLG